MDDGQTNTSGVTSWVRISRNRSAVQSLFEGAVPDVGRKGSLAVIPVPFTIAAPGTYFVRGYAPLFSLAYIMIASPIWRIFEPHFTLLAVSRARLSDGSKIEISSAMIPMTTSS